MEKDITKLDDKELRKYYKELKNRKAKYKNKQLAAKIFLNSLYGGMGNPYFRYYDIRLAEAVTLTGQTMIRLVDNGVNTYLNSMLNSNSDVNQDFVIAGDTDSIIITLNDVVKKCFKDQIPEDDKVVDFVDAIASKKITPVIDNISENARDYFNCKESYLVMKREVIANKGIWTAKKKYILRKLDDEGLRLGEPKLKIMGIESVRTSTPAVCRTKIEEALNIILEKSEKDLIDFVEAFKVEFKTLDENEIAFPRGVHGMENYTGVNTIYTSGCPIHVRASLLHNNLIDRLKLNKEYEKIKNGDKIKFLYLLTPNPIEENIIGFVTELPKAFKLHNSIDYTTQFDKAFLSPMRLITEAIGWNVEHVATLNKFFA